MADSSSIGADAAAYFNGYSAAFAAYDSDRIAALFDQPLTVLTAARPIVHADLGAVRTYVDGMLDSYRHIGLAWPVPAAVWAWPCGDNLARAEVLWLLRSADRAEIMRFSTSYVLRRDVDAGWRVAVVISYEEPVKLPAGGAGA